MAGRSGWQHFGGVRNTALVIAVFIALLALADCKMPWTSQTSPRPTPTTTPASPLASQTIYWNQNGQLTALRASDGKVRWHMDVKWASCGNDGCAFTYGPLTSTLDGDTLYSLGTNDHRSAAVNAIATRDGMMRWQTPVAGCLAAPMASPLVASGVVYVSLTEHWSGGVGCGPTGWVYALRASDGHVLWRVPFAQSVWPTLALTDGVLVVGNSTDNKFPAMSWITGLRASDGKQLWRISRATDKIEFTADSGLVITKTTAGIRYDSGLRVEALRASDGVSLWESAVIPSSDPVYFMDPLLVNGIAYVFSASGDLYALGVSDGQMVWHIQMGAHSVGPLTFANGRIYFGRGRDLDVFNATTGALIRSFRFFDQPTVSNDPNYVWSTAVVTDSAIFVSVGVYNCLPRCHLIDLDGHLYALDVATGKMLWQYQTPHGFQVTAPMLSS